RTTQRRDPYRPDPPKLRLVRRAERAATMHPELRGLRRPRRGLSAAADSAGTTPDPVRGPTGGDARYMSTTCPSGTTTAMQREVPTVSRPTGSSREHESSAPLLARPK